MDVFEKGDPEMKKVLFALTALAALALMAPNSVVAANNNHIGIYATETPDINDLEASATLELSEGQFTIYVLVTMPYNDNTGMAMENLGGFEFRIEWPADWFVTPTLHASATNFLSAPDFFCGANAPVVNNMVTVVSLACGTFDFSPTLFHITPISDPSQQTIPGSIAVTDADDNFSISEAFPASGDFANPVFGFNMTVVSNEDKAWGGVKALFSQ